MEATWTVEDDFRFISQYDFRIAIKADILQEITVTLADIRVREEETSTIVFNQS